MADRPPRHRVIGWPGGAMTGRIALPDDITLIGASIDRAGHPFAGAFVPVSLHDPAGAEAAFDSAEWAAELLRSRGRTWFVLSPFVPPVLQSSSTMPVVLSRRSWNHSIAMIRRLQVMAERHGLGFHLRELLDGRPAGPIRMDPDRSIHYVLDTAGLLGLGWKPRELTPADPADRPTG